jgi:hypothetical protein
MAKATTKAIRKELAILIKETKLANPDGNENKIVNDCRQAINTNHGKGWRERDWVGDVQDWCPEEDRDFGYPNEYWKD